MGQCALLSQQSIIYSRTFMEPKSVASPGRAIGMPRWKVQELVLALWALRYLFLPRPCVGWLGGEEEGGNEPLRLHFSGSWISWRALAGAQWAGERKKPGGCFPSLCLGQHLWLWLHLFHGSSSQRTGLSFFQLLQVTLAPGLQ